MIILLVMLMCGKVSNKKLISSYPSIPLNIEIPFVYKYSRSGNTEKIALQAQKDLLCEILKIVPEEEYGNYVASCLRVTKEKKGNYKDWIEKVKNECA